MDLPLHLARSSRRCAPITQIRVAVPIRNEAERLEGLLTSLAEAADAVALPVALDAVANNCTDDSAALLRAFRHPAVTLDLHEITFPDGEASAGRARRLAMDRAARSGALVMTTDADSVMDPGWMVAALRAVEAGADLVCGMIEADLGDILACPSVARIARIEAPYGALVHEIRHCIDRMTGRQPLGEERPHYVESGACMAIRADRYRHIGGLPALCSSEDRALVHLAGTHGLAITYSRDMRARVSGRLDGRAAGGMAECLRSRMQDDDPLADQAMLAPEFLAMLWQRARTGLLTVYPDRSLPVGRRLRASDLEAALPRLRAFVDTTVRPQYADWQRALGGGAV